LPIADRAIHSAIVGFSDWGILNGALVHWRIGALVHWCIGALAHWRIEPCSNRMAHCVIPTIAR
jgi:hypothetical protein